MADLVIAARRGAEFESLRLVTGFVIMGFLLGATGTGLAVGLSPNVATSSIAASAALGQATLLALTAMSLSACLGFLFAVPRARTVDQRPGGLLESSTNLEGVADWLTKMTVGALLVSLPRGPEIIAQLRDFSSIGGHSDWGERIGLMTALYFAMLGFLAGYVAARMWFITTRDRAPFVVTALEALQRVPVGPDGVQRTNLSLEELSAVEGFSRLPVSQMRGRVERWLWAKSQLVVRDGNLTEAISTYGRLLDGYPDPQMLLERSVARMLSGEPDDIPRSDRHDLTVALPRPASAQASVNQMFLDLYEPPPEGFERAILIGEDLVTRLREASVWAYLACAYGQKYRYLLSRGGAAATELDAIRERALFSVKQTLDLDAPQWRSILRGLWDRNAVRSDGDDDLVAFSGDPQFAALLDSESMISAAASTSGTPSSPRLARYAGSARIWITDERGLLVVGEVPEIRAGSSYRLIIQLTPEGAATGSEELRGTVQDVRVLEGDDRPRVEFDFHPDGIEMRFSPERSTVAASVSERSGECGFDFRAPAPRSDGPEERDIYLEVGQGRRILRTIPVKVRIAPADV